MNIPHLNPQIAIERLIKQLRTKGITSEAVLNAMRQVPRHLFVDGAMYAQAYDDNALPIGCGQTISQPYVVALMTQLLDLKKDEKILELGTGSGYQTAILAQFSRRVYTMERNRDLGEASFKRLREMGFVNIVCKIGDGTRGWVQHAPYDRIIVTAGAPALPAELASQLANGGRMVIPVGDRGTQQLEVYDKEKSQLKKSVIDGAVVFVPLVGESGWKTDKK
jgi:protein-L-isoaspartate(D-aspartate) O-methyltransferase